MESRIRSASPLNATSEVKQEESSSLSNKISAYYSLVFPHFTFYIQTLSVTIGRRCNPNTSNSSSSSTAEPVQVDVDLGALKSVSRLHAKIEYDPDEDRFMLVVIGRNGAWVDGVWQGSGTRAPLGERSQIQIASRTFHFVLPPPPPPEDTPSPSSHSSTNRPRSPSLDITSISPPSSQPSHSPPPQKPKPPTPPPEPQLGNSNAIARSTKANAKKRKKSETTEIPIPPLPVKERPRPEEIPPKPTLTYAQLIYRAIKAHDGKATLQEICTWIMNEFEFYRYTEGNAWMSSVRHNLSSGRAFKKMERCGGDRGKGFFWSLDETHQHTLEEQDKLAGTALDGIGGKGRKKDKGAPLSEPPLKRSVKGDFKGGVLPPPLTSTPLAMKTTSTSPPTASSTAVKTPAAPTPTGVFAYHPMMTATTVTSSYSGTPLNAPNPYAALTQQWQMQSKYSATTSTPATSATVTASTTPVSSTSNLATVPAPSAVSSSALPSSVTATSASSSAPQTSQSAVPDVAIPIVLGPIPPTHPNYSPTHPNNSAKEGYMILHERRLILDPDVFSGLTKDMLTELERMGARQAIEVLTGHMVRVLKERRKSRKSARGRGRGGKGPGGSGRKAAAPGVPSGQNESTGPTSGPFTTAPLPPRGASATVSTSASPAPLALDSKPSSSAQGMPTSNVVVDDVGSPIVIVDSDDEGPAIKKRKIDDLSASAPLAPAPPPMASLLS